MGKHGGFCPVPVKTRTGKLCPIGHVCGSLHGKRTCYGKSFCQLGRSVRYPREFRQAIAALLEQRGLHTDVCPIVGPGGVSPGEVGDCFTHRGHQFYSPRIGESGIPLYVHCDDPDIACLLKRLQMVLVKRDAIQPAVRS